MSAWVFVVRPENWEKLNNASTTAWVFSNRYSKALSKMEPGDKAAIYVSRIGAFTAILNILGQPYTTSSTSIRFGDAYPIRVPIAFELVISEPSKYVPIEPLLPALSSISARSTLQGSLRRLSDNDFALIYSRVQKQAL